MSERLEGSAWAKRVEAAADSWWDAIGPGRPGRYWSQIDEDDRYCTREWVSEVMRWGFPEAYPGVKEATDALLALAAPPPNGSAKDAPRAQPHSDIE